jgi:SAM-dependent methyltransferase
MKKKTNLAKQYDGKVKEFISQNEEMNSKSTRVFNAYLDPWIKAQSFFKDVKIIEFGCGDGGDLSRLTKYASVITGIDASAKMCKAARSLSSHFIIYQKDFTKPLDLKFASENDKYDLLLSKWAMQTAMQIYPVYKNAVEVLKSGGRFLFLVVHPFRQFLEKRIQPRNYFEKEIVQSRIFNKTITVDEPSHTMEEYFSQYFLSQFEVDTVKEGYEFPAAEQIGGEIYPTYLIVVAIKK